MDVDTNIDNYMIPDLFDLLGIDEDSSSVDDVVDSVFDYIDEIEKSAGISAYKKEDMVNFFENIRDALVFYIEDEGNGPEKGGGGGDGGNGGGDGGNGGGDGGDGGGGWDGEDGEEDEGLDLVGQNATERDVVTSGGTNRMWETVGDNVAIDTTTDHNAMRDRNIDVPASGQLRTDGIVKGVLNPHIKNVVTRIVNIDSQFRQFVVENEYKNAGDFTIDLSEPLTNVLSIRCYSAQIPFMWYVFDEANQTNAFWIDDTKISIDSGNYTPDDLATEINRHLRLVTDTGFDDVVCSATAKNGKIQFDLGSSVKTLRFFDPSRVVEQKMNQTMGWTMGFRRGEYYNNTSTVESTTVVGEAIADLYGTKYVYIYLDEFSANRVNTSMVNMSDMPHDIVSHMSTIPTDVSRITNAAGATQIIPEDPRRNTIAQRYAMNRIFENQSNNAAYPYMGAPSTTNIFTMIPIKKTGLQLGDPFIEFGGSLQSGERVYFGPVNITKFRVKLLDDRGRTINLNGGDWSFSFLCETLYQKADTHGDQPAHNKRTLV
jgi:hypothetical protein